MNPSPAAIKSGVATLRYYRAFIRSDYELARKPFDPWGGTMTRDEAQKTLWDLIDRKINERAGKVKETRKMGDGYQADLFHDRLTLRDIDDGIRRYQLMTRYCRERFSHLLSSHED